jgi:hypothetical protein
MSTRKRTDINNFYTDEKCHRINSPRSVEAMRRKGVVFNELAPVDRAAVIEEVRA